MAKRIDDEGFRVAIFSRFPNEGWIGTKSSKIRAVILPQCQAWSARASNCCAAMLELPTISES